MNVLRQKKASVSECDSQLPHSGFRDGLLKRRIMQVSYRGALDPFLLFEGVGLTRRTENVRNSTAHARSG
jgi:hypothetical protein